MQADDKNREHRRLEALRRELLATRRDTVRIEQLEHAREFLWTRRARLGYMEVPAFKALFRNMRISQTLPKLRVVTRRYQESEIA